MSVSAERLAAHDLYHYLDWLREAFEAGDQALEVEVRDPGSGRRRLRLVFQRDHQLRRLERVLSFATEPFRGEALAIVEELKCARMREGVPVDELARLRSLVSEWDRGRPLLRCGFQYPGGARCTIAYRSPARLAEHRSVVHGVPERRR